MAANRLGTFHCINFDHRDRHGRQPPSLSHARRRRQQKCTPRLHLCSPVCRGTLTVAARDINDRAGFAAAPTMAEHRRQPWLPSALSSPGRLMVGGYRATPQASCAGPGAAASPSADRVRAGRSATRPARYAASAAAVSHRRNQRSDDMNLQHDIAIAAEATRRFLRDKVAIQ